LWRKATCVGILPHLSPQAKQTRQKMPKPIAWAPTEAQLLAAYATQKYPLFGGSAARPRPYDINLFGIRKETNAKPGTYDDVLGYTLRLDNGRRITRFFPGTTDPGLPELLKPTNKSGVAVVKPGHYPGLWELGLHKRKTPALVQVAPIVVYRDNNKDGKADTKGMKEQRGLFGINMHPESVYREENVIGLWSAGCQVPYHNADMDELLRVCREQVRRGWGRRFSYTLFTESEVIQ